MYWQGEERGIGEEALGDSMYQDSLLPMITYLPVPAVGLRAGVGAAVWELSGTLWGQTYCQEE